MKGCGISTSHLPRLLQRYRTASRSGAAVEGLAHSGEGPLGRFLVWGRVAEELVDERGEQAGEPGLFLFVLVAAQDFGGDFFGGVG
jgi:hypothetical protein